MVGIAVEGRGTEVGRAVEGSACKIGSIFQYSVVEAHNTVYKGVIDPYRRCNYLDVL